MEEQALKLIDFVRDIADYPFTILEDGKNHEYVTYIIGKAVNHLESLAEGYIIVDTQMHHAQTLNEARLQTTVAI